MKFIKLLLSLSLILTSFQLFPQDEDAHAIREVLEAYISATAEGNPQMLAKVFHPELNLYSVNTDGTLKTWKGQDYISVFKQGQIRDRIGEVLSIDFENDAGTAKVRIQTPSKSYIDYFLLLKINGAWKIIHKSYTQTVTANKTKPLSEADIDFIKMELEQILADDQKYRPILALGTLNDSIIRKDKELRASDDQLEEYVDFLQSVPRDITKLQEDSIRILQANIDFINYKRLRNLIDRFGYPSTKRLRSDGLDPFSVLLHPPSSKDLNPEVYLIEMGKLLKKEVLDGRMDASSFAMFYDNISYKILQRPPLYGVLEAFNRETGKMMRVPVGNIEKTNAARKEINLKPLVP